MNRNQTVYLVGVLSGVALSVSLYRSFKKTERTIKESREKATFDPSKPTNKKVKTILTDCPYEVVSVKVAV